MKQKPVKNSAIVSVAFMFRGSIIKLLKTKKAKYSEMLADGNLHNGSAERSWSSST